MQSVQDVYNSAVSQLPSEEQLCLASLILNGMTQKHRSHHAGTSPRRSMREILNELPGGRIFKTAAEVDAYLREERDSWER